MLNEEQMSNIISANNKYNSAAYRGSGVSAAKQTLMNVMFNCREDLVETIRSDDVREAVSNAEMDEMKKKLKRLQADFDSMMQSLDEADKENNELKKQLDAATRKINKLKKAGENNVES